MWTADPALGYRLVTTHGSASVSDMVEITDGAERRSIRSSELYPCNPEEQLGVADNCALLHLHEPGLLQNLKHRFEQQSIYTYTAMILIAVNPYQQLPRLYDDMERYRGRAIGHSPPHVYALADRAHRRLRSEQRSQTFVISGESGSGKTETAKHIMRFLGQANGGLENLAARDVGTLIVDSNPILEAVGNAKTARNNNSSRFGKFVKMHFDHRNSLIGGTIQTYLLETSRLVQQDASDRNYHIFYQLIRGLSAAERVQIGLDDSPEVYHYLRQSGCTRVRVHEHDDGADCARLRHAMERMGIHASEQLATFAVLAALLTLGNVAFQPSESAAGDGSRISDAGVLLDAAQKLGLYPDDLSHCLRFRKVAVGGRAGEPVLIALDVHAAAHARDALAKELYSRVFDRVVAKINARLALADGAFAFIGVLDIFGFESFARNSFEQLCINFANERLQQYFNDQVLRQEHEIYATEGIRHHKVEFADNQECIDLFLASPGGIFPTLEDEQTIPRASDVTFTEKVLTRHRGCPRLSSPKATKGVGLNRREGFVIRHYAGEVLYQSHGFLDKNTDVLHASLDELIRSSSSAMIQSLYATDDDDRRSPAPAPAPKGGRKSVAGGRAAKATTSKTVSGKFTRQLAQLMEVLQATSSHFIRCIKPSDSQRPGDFNGPKVLSQLRCGGMVEAVRILNTGFPTRCGLDEIHARYATAMPDEIRSLDAASFSEALMMGLGLRRSDYQIGITKVFFRVGRLAFLEELAAQSVDGQLPVEMVARIKSWLRRRKLMRCIYAVVVVVRLRARLRRSRALARFHRAAMVLRIVGVTWMRLLRRARARRGCTRIQAHIRRRRDVTQLRQQRASAVTIQRIAHGWRARRRTAPLLQALRAQRRVRDTGPTTTCALAASAAASLHDGDARELWRALQAQSEWQRQREEQWQRQFESLRLQLDEERTARARLDAMIGASRKSHVRSDGDGGCGARPHPEAWTAGMSPLERLAHHRPSRSDEPPTTTRMSSELMRVRSFGRGYPTIGAVSAKRLAAAGFYYSPSEKHADRVVCCACHVAIHSWDAGDDPLQEHRRWGDGACAFVKHLESTSVPASW